MTEPITLERFAQQVAVYKDSTNVNPRDGDGSCLYNGPDGSHCFIGQILADFGIEVPFSGEGLHVGAVLNRGGEHSPRSRFEASDFPWISELAELLQEFADMRSRGGDTTWAEAIQKVRTLSSFRLPGRARNALVDACEAAR